MNKKKYLKIAAEFLGIFVALALTIFVIANFNALSSKVTYWWAERFGSSDFFKDEVAGLGAASEIIPPDDRLVVPKLGLNVPLIFPENPETQALLEDLKKGVVHYPGTALPGQLGNLFIAGHSSQHAWESGNYKNVFTLINELESGDEIIVYFEEEKYVYQVANQKVVSAADSSVLESSDSPVVTLMTCWPVGTIAKRLVVTANYDAEQSTGKIDTANSQEEQEREELNAPQELPAIR